MTSTTEAARSRKDARPGRFNKTKLTPYLFILPNMAIFATFTIWPAINGFNMSLYESSNGRTFKWVGLGNYRKILTDDEFWQVAMQTAIYTLAFVVLSTVFAIMIATFINQQKKAKVFFRAVYFVPVLVSPVVVGLIWNWILDRQGGLLNAFLGLFGIAPVPWLVDPSWSMVAIIMVGVWMQTGFYMLILLAGLQSIDPVYYEASRMDGASALQQFRGITIPLLQPSIVVVVILATIHGFQSFDFIWTLTGGGPLGATTLMVQYIYENGFESPIRFGIATAGGVLLFIAVFILTMINWVISKRSEAV